MEKIKNNSSEPSEISPAKAMNELAGIEQEIRMGPTDSELDALNNIRSQLIVGDITPEDAIHKAKTLEQERSSHYR